MTDNSILECALKYLEHGFAIIPLAGKNPVVKWGIYQKQLPTRDEVFKWFDGQDHNIGVLTGDISGIAVLDIDGDTGRESLLGKHIPPTPTVTTGNGGEHLYFRIPTKIPIHNRVRFLPGLDLRGNGGIAVVPPSIHPITSKLYQWSITLDQEDPAEMPDWLISAIQASSYPISVRVNPVKVLAGIEDGRRDIELFRYASRLRGLGISKEEAIILVLTAAAACNPIFPEKEALQKVESAFERYPEGNVVQQRYTIRELLEQNLPEVDWLIPEILPKGVLAIITGKPKKGKSFLMLQLANALACGQEFLGVQLHPRRVLYYALEDGKRSLQSRVQKQGIDATDDFVVYDSCPPVDENWGLEKLEHEIQGFDLAIIDTFAAARMKKIDENAAGILQPQLNRLWGIAQQSGTTVLLVHHNRKGPECQDPIEDMRGSSAIPAKGDVLMGLYSMGGDNTRNFSIRGRDIMERTLALLFDPLTCTFTSRGEAREIEASEALKRALDCLKEFGGRASSIELAKELGIQTQAVRKTLDKHPDLVEILTTSGGRGKTTEYRLRFTGLPVSVLKTQTLTCTSIPLDISPLVQRDMKFLSI